MCVYIPSFGSEFIYLCLGRGSLLIVLSFGSFYLIIAFGSKSKKFAIGQQITWNIFSFSGFDIKAIIISLLHLSKLIWSKRQGLSILNWFFCWTVLLIWGTVSRELKTSHGQGSEEAPARGALRDEEDTEENQWTSGSN